MAVETQDITDKYAIWNGDCCEVMKSMPDNSIDLSIYSPPFCGLYQYSSSEADMSNCRTYEEFFEHYSFLVNHITRVTQPGRMTAVHCMDTPKKTGGLSDFPGDIIRLHEPLGWEFHARFGIWKEPLHVAIRTRSQGLTYRQLQKDSTVSNNAGMDQVLIFRKKGENKVPVTKPQGILKYAGAREVPSSFTDKNGDTYTPEQYAKGEDWGDSKPNKLAHWIWQQYASSFWDDVRINRVLPYKAARERDDEKHVHPLQLDVIERIVVMWSNPGEKVLTPFMGVGSEVCGALVNGRRGLGIELKPSYYRQAQKNIAECLANGWGDDLQTELLDGDDHANYQAYDANRDEASRPIPAPPLS